MLPPSEIRQRIFRSNDEIALWNRSPVPKYCLREVRALMRGRRCAAAANNAPCQNDETRVGGDNYVPTHSRFVTR